MIFTYIREVYTVSVARSYFIIYYQSRRPIKVSYLTLVPATGGGVFLPPSAVFAENRQLNNGLRQLVFVTLSQTLLAF